MRFARLGLGGVGVLGGLYGAWLLLSRQDLSQLRDAALWLAGGVVLHDFVLAPLVLAAVALGSRVMPSHSHRPLVIAMVVLGALSLLAIPVLGRFGARADNPSLLPRDYMHTWLFMIVVTVLVLAAVVAIGVVRRDRPAETARDVE